MIKIKPALSKGTRDFLPVEVAKRQYIFDTIKNVFRKYGFEPIETPAIERLETLTGKYGEEGDKLLFKILNSGDYLTDVRQLNNTNLDLKEVTPLIAEKGLRYDLTVPLARYVVQHQDKLTFPFKRYHIGPVWRADRPQKGRYQEFYQCDADVIGSSSLFSEVELTMIYSEVFKKLKLDVSIQLNHRKVLLGIAEYWGVPNEKFGHFVNIIDKLDKIGYSGVASELQNSGIALSINETIDENALSHFDVGIVSNSTSWEDLFSRLINEKFQNSELGKEGANELLKVFKHIPFGSNCVFNPFLARGLDYYTGVVWEVKPTGVVMGSIGGGGRYENLTEIFGGKNMSGVGVSFGIERIYDVMEELGLFPDTLNQSVQVLVVSLLPEVDKFAFEQTQALRQAGVAAEFFTGNIKKQKQFNFATDKNIPFIIEITAEDKASETLRVKNLGTKEISQVAAKELCGFFKG
jgi:histidyl-tRNA synthetase